MDVLTSSSSPSPTLSPVTRSKLDSLYEVEYYPDTSSQDFPLMNPYSIFHKPSYSPLRKFKTLLQQKPKLVKEYIFASRVDQHTIPAGGQEQFLTLYIPPEFVKQWQIQGFTHLHFGAIRLGLTLHGRKGIPMIARIALLDTRFLKYQHTCIATMETTLNAGTIFLTLYPNFNMSLSNPLLLEALKVQLQIIGAEQDQRAYTATLNYQIVYRVQNHAMDLALHGSDDALILSVDNSGAASCTHVPRQITKEELLQLLPETWVSNYDRLHRATNQPIQSNDSLILPNADGTLSIKFDHSHIMKPRHSVSLPAIHMIRMPVTSLTRDFQYLEPDDEKDFYKDLKFEQQLYRSFTADGSPLLWQSNPHTGHKFWDLDCSCSECLDPDQETDEIPKLKKKSKKKKKKDPLWKEYQEENPTVDLLGQPSGKYDFLVRYDRPRQTEYMIVPPPEERLPPGDTPCPDPETDSSPQKNLMFQEQTVFPSVQPFIKDQARHTSKILNSNSTILPSGQPKPTSDVEAVLNRKSESALALNNLTFELDLNLQLKKFPTQKLCLD